MNERRTRTVPPGSRVILRAVVGSTVHGTQIASQDDRDEMAIAVEPPEYVLGLREWVRGAAVERTQPEGTRSGPGDLDLTTYTLRKFARLAASGNPTIMIPLFAPESAILFIDELGRNLIANRSIFLSAKVRETFLGYLRAQRMRLTGQQGQMRVTRTKLIEKFGYDTKYAGHIIRLGFQGHEMLTQGRMTLPMQAFERQAVVEIRNGEWPLEDVLSFAQQQENAIQHAITALPPEPDWESIDRFLCYAYRSTWHEGEMT